MMRVLTFFMMVLLIGTGLAAPVAAQPAQPSNPNFTGTGGKGMSLAVLEPTGKGLSKDEQWMLSLIQSSITGDFNKFSAMTIIDRQHVEKIMADVAQAMESGYYSDETMVKVGHMTNARYILTGVVSRTANTYMLELAVTDAQSGERKASYSPKSISPRILENLSAVKEASADLLKQLGVALTEKGQEELLKPLPIHQIQGQTALAHGITAQRQGTEVTALSYFYQATALDPSLIEATNRQKVITANITSGNIGADVRNEIAWRKAWIAKLTEFEEFFSKMINATVDPPYSFFYSTEIQRGKINFQTETIDLSIATNLRANKAWMNSIAQAANSVYGELNAGLNATKKRNEWGLGNWPKQGVTNSSPFASRTSKQYDISIAFELLNDRNQIIGKQMLGLKPSFSLSGNNDRIINNYTENTFNTIAFNAVNANDISDNLAIRIASVNGNKPENARFQITAWTKEQGQVQGRGSFTDPRNKRTYRTIGIPSTTVGIPGTVWMAENLDYQTGNSWCYGNNSSNCNKYGRLYDWNTAMKACPVGWHLPIRENWKTLVGATDGLVAGAKLKSKSPNWNGEDAYGFSALPGGNCYVGGAFYGLGAYGLWWSATEYDASYAWRQQMSSGDTDVSVGNDKSNGFSVRCLQD